MYTSETREPYTLVNNPLGLNHNVSHAPEGSDLYTESRLNAIDSMPTNDNSAKLIIYYAP